MTTYRPDGSTIRSSGSLISSALSHVGQSSRQCKTPGAIIEERWLVQLVGGWSCLTRGFWQMQEVEDKETTVRLGRKALNDTGRVKKDSESSVDGSNFLVTISTSPAGYGW